MDSSLRPGAVIAAVDGSRHADVALRWAAGQAVLEHRPLAVVSVGDDDAYRITQQAVRQLDGLSPDLEVLSVAVVGDPRAVLVDLSERAHLLVLGTRGRGPVRRLLLGSVSSAVSTLAHCPVVVARSVTRGDEGNGVLVAADGTAESLPVIEYAFDQASLRGLPLTAVHCVWDVVAAVAGQRNVRIEDADQGVGDEAHRLLAESVAGFGEKYPDVTVRTRVTHGLAEDVLGWRTGAWDLVVVGRHPRQSAGRVVEGSVAAAVVEHARTTVAVVPEACAPPPP